MSRFNSNRSQEGGRLAVYKDDFNKHVHGSEFRHTADNIDMNPPIPSLGEPTVQSTLEQFTALITAAGSGFISIGNAGGDGYALGSYNINTVATPTFRDALLAAFNDDRLQNGGVVLVLAGTYVLTAPVEVPAGITIMGEYEGSIIIGEMTEQSMFIIKRGTKDVRIGGDAGLGPITADIGNNLNGIHFFNITLFDNLNRTVAGGDASMLTVPMIVCEKSSIFTCDQVKFVGRVNDGSGAGRAKTLRAIGYTTGGTSGTYLSVKDCYFDGLKTAIDFSPGNGSLDTLIVSNCRARTFGTELFASLTPADNCFVTFSRCNASFTNNYHVGALGSVQPSVNACFVMTATTGSTGEKIVITGNNGGGTFSAGQRLFYDATSTNMYVIRSGNNWGSDFTNNWFVVVGNGSPGSGATGRAGDFVGPNAIDTFLTAVSGLGPVTVIVNPGSYTITNSGSADISYIGNATSSNSFPVFNMNVTSGNDTFSRRTFITGRTLKNIRFRCVTSTTSNFHSIWTQAVANKTEVDGCVFHNTGLFGARASLSSVDSASDRYNYVVTNCNFIQDGTYTNNSSLILPTAHTVLVENCTFRNFGYLGGCGEVDSTAYTHNASTPNVVFRNCLMDMTGGTITASNSISGLSKYQSYFWFSDSTAKFTLENCQIMVNNGSSESSTTISSSLTSAGTYTKHMYILAKEIVIDNCLFNGPTQTYTTGGLTYQMPTLFLESPQTIKYTRNRSIQSGFPLQIGGANLLNNAASRGSIIISDSEFVGISNTGAYCMIDIDLDLNSAPSNTEFMQIVVKNNHFSLHSTNSPVRVQHTRATGSFYNAFGMLQIYANYCNVLVTGNNFNGQSVAPSTNPYTYLSSIVVNNYDSNAGAGARITAAVISDNTVHASTTFSTASATNTATGIWVKSSSINVNNNFIGMENNGGISSSFVGCLHLDARPTSSGSSADAIVTGNTFNRRNEGGIAVSLVRGFIYIDSNSGRGSIINNAFGDFTINGSSTTLVEDNSARAWIYYANKNQTETHVLFGPTGSIQENAQFTHSYNLAAPPSTSLTMSYTTGATGSFTWYLPIDAIIPQGSHIVEASCTVSVNLNGTSITSDTWQFTLSGLTSGTSVGTPAFDFSPDTYTSNTDQTCVITPGNTSNSNTFINQGTANDQLILFLQLTNWVSISNCNISINAIEITYRW